MGINSGEKMFHQTRACNPSPSPPFFFVQSHSFAIIFVFETLRISSVFFFLFGNDFNQVNETYNKREDIFLLKRKLFIVVPSSTMIAKNRTYTHTYKTDVQFFSKIKKTPVLFTNLRSSLCVCACACVCFSSFFYVFVHSVARE